MTPHQLISEAAALDIRLAITSEGKLRIDAPVGVVTPNLRAAFSSHRDALVKLCADRATVARLGGGLDQPSAPEQAVTGVPTRDWPTMASGTEEGSSGSPPEAASKKMSRQTSGFLAPEDVGCSRKWMTEFSWVSDVKPDDLPRGPFRLNGFTTIVDFEKYLTSLQDDVNRGERGPRARTGALQSDCEKLKGILAWHRGPGTSPFFSAN